MKLSQITKRKRDRVLNHAKGRRKNNGKVAKPSEFDYPDATITPPNMSTGNNP